MIKIINNQSEIKCFLRTNFIKYHKGYESNYVTYYYDNSLSKDFIIMRSFIYTFLKFNMTPNMICNTSIHQLLKTLGVKSINGGYARLKIYKTLCEVMEWFVDNKYITILNNNLNRFRLNDLIEIQINTGDFYLSEDFKGGKSVSNEPFIVILINEFNEIVEKCKSKPHTLFYVFAYIKSCIAFRKGNTNPQDVPQCALLTYEGIADTLHLSRPTITACIEELCEIGVLARRQIKKIPGIKNTAPYIYTATSVERWADELKYGYAKFSDSYFEHYKLNHISQTGGPFRDWEQQ